ncbi:MAG TPA: hypothetical protein VLE48_02165 [Terriglobales bacterium]|nr:hypothetical protein [Terriglobales bacterium]
MATATKQMEVVVPMPASRVIVRVSVHYEASREQASEQREARDDEQSAGTEFKPTSPCRRNQVQAEECRKTCQKDHERMSGGEAEREEGQAAEAAAGGPERGDGSQVVGAKPVQNPSQEDGAE